MTRIWWPNLARTGNWIGDRELIVSIEFDSDFDYKNNYKDKEGDFVYDSKKGKAFIRKLTSKTYGGGGKRNKHAVMV